MPRTYKPDPLGKKYSKHDTNLIQQAIKEYLSGTSSLNAISQKYKIHKSVLHRHFSKDTKSQGGQTVLSKETEEIFIKYINICADWGYLLEGYDLRILVKVYLDNLGIEEKRFKNNMPGPDFVSSFMKRHKDVISQRLKYNIKRNRLSVTSEVLKYFFEELEISLNGVALSNIINYDITNLSDDPGCEDIIVENDEKYLERMNNSNSALSIMIACTAEGELLPPYVVDREQNLCNNDMCTAKGSRRTRYNRTQSGWFDATIFEDWVKSVIIPYFHEKPGKKVLIGDNLSTHLSIDLIKLCHEENISFVFLPPASTHITQPLDVAFFRSMKLVWRNILYQWKKTDGCLQTTISKESFPHLLSLLLDTLKDNAKDYILAGFEKTGINPLDLNQVLQRFKLMKNKESNQDKLRTKKEKAIEKNQKTLQPSNDTIDINFLNDNERMSQMFLDGNHSITISQSNNSIEVNFLNDVKTVPIMFEDIAIDHIETVGDSKVSDNNQ